MLALQSEAGGLTLTKGGSGQHTKVDVVVEMLEGHMQRDGSGVGRLVVKLRKGPENGMSAGVRGKSDQQAG